MNDHADDLPRKSRPERGPYRSPALSPADVATIAALEEDRWKCHCGNIPHSDGFAPANRRGREVEPTPDQWPEPLYVCNRCGLVMDAATVNLTTHTVAVVGRILL